MRLDRHTIQALALATQIGTSIVASVGIAIGGGYLLDKWLNTKPIFLLIGVVVGIIAAWYTLMSLNDLLSRGNGNSNKSDHCE